MPRMQADTNLFYHRSTYKKGEEFEVLDTDVKALEDQNLAHVVKSQTSKSQDVETSKPSNDSTETVEVSESMKRSELEAAAEQAGLEGPYEQYDTKADLVKAIEAHQQQEA